MVLETPELPALYRFQMMSKNMWKKKKNQFWGHLVVPPGRYMDRTRHPQSAKLANFGWFSLITSLPVVFPGVPRLQSMFGVSLETIEPETRMWWSKFQKKSKFQKSFRKYLENGWTDFQSGNRVGKVLMCTTSLPPVRIWIRVEIKELRAKKGEKITFFERPF